VRRNEAHIVCDMLASAAAVTVAAAGRVAEERHRSPRSAIAKLMSAASC